MTPARASWRLRWESRPWGASADSLRRPDAGASPGSECYRSLSAESTSPLPEINQSLKSRRDSLDPSIIANMVAGYRFVDNLLAQRVDLLAMSNLKLFLELNALVLCGHD